MDADAVEDNAQSGPAAQSEESDGGILLTASFGVVGTRPYDPIKHVSEDVARVPDGQLYAENQIHWCLREGEITRQTGLHFEIDWICDVDDLNTLVRLAVVTSNLPSANLPQSLKHDGARSLCSLEWPRDLVYMNSVLKVKNRRFYSTKPKYWEAKLIVQFGFDPQARRLSITRGLADGRAMPGSRVTWVDPDNLDDGCSVISMPPPMYSLMRPESFASSIFRRFARGDSRDDDETEKTEADPPASRTRSGD